VILSTRYCLDDIGALKDVDARRVLVFRHVVRAPWKVVASLAAFTTPAPHRFDGFGQAHRFTPVSRSTMSFENRLIASGEMALA
jgi:hypothetical protein